MRPPLTPTDHARALLRRGLHPADVAEATSLHYGYVRKLIQRDAGRDESWAAWRANHPNSVRAYRAKQNEARKAARRSSRVSPAA